VTLRIPNAAEEAMLDLILAEGYTLRLFTNDVESGLTEAQKEALTAGSFTEATFAGYAGIALTGGSWVTTQGDDESTGVYAQQTFTRSSTGTAQVIRGYYVTRTTGGALRWYEYFPGPVTVTNINDAIRVTPTFTLDDHREATVAARGMVVAPQILTAFSSGYTTDTTTDFALANVPVDPTRDYAVKLHSAYALAGIPGRWLIYLYVDGVQTLRLDDIDVATGGAVNGMLNSEVIWRPSAVGTPDLDVRRDEVSGTSTLTFAADAIAQRQFSVEDIGPRLT
jgi:hypothetical protein